MAGAAVTMLTLTLAAANTGHSGGFQTCWCSASIVAAISACGASGVAGGARFS